MELVKDEKIDMVKFTNTDCLIKPIVKKFVHDLFKSILESYKEKDKFLPVSNLVIHSGETVCEYIDLYISSYGHNESSNDVKITILNFLFGFIAACSYVGFSKDEIKNYAIDFIDKVFESSKKRDSFKTYQKFKKEFVRINKAKMDEQMNLLKEEIQQYEVSKDDQNKNNS